MKEEVLLINNKYHYNYTILIKINKIKKFIRKKYTYKRKNTYTKKKIKRTLLIMKIKLKYKKNVLYKKLFKKVKNSKFIKVMKK